MKIVRATLDNLQQVSSLFNQYRVFYKQQSDYVAAENFMRARLSNGDSYVFLALSENNEAMGFIQLYPSFSSVGMSKILILNDLYVDVSFQNQGIATALMQAAEHFAIKEGAARITLCTQTTNVPAQQLYEKLQYKQNVEFMTYNLICHF